MCTVFLDIKTRNRETLQVLDLAVRTKDEYVLRVKKIEENITVNIIRK